MHIALQWSMYTERSYSYLDDDRRVLDKGIVAGGITALLFIIFSVIASGQGISSLNPLGFFIVFGGTCAAAFVHYSQRELQYGWDCFMNLLFFRSNNLPERMRYLLTLATKTRRDGVLVLEDEGRIAEDALLKKAFTMISDGTSVADLKRALETDIRTSYECTSKGVQIFHTMGTYAPALGLVGTILGMMEMLSALHNPSQIGPGMATALSTTLYGALFANLIFLPISGKLKNRLEEENTLNLMTLEGVLGIANQEGALSLESKLESFLANGRS